MKSPIVRLVSSTLVRFVAFLVSLTIAVGILRSVYTLSQKKGIVAERQAVLQELLEKNKQLQNDLREATSSAFIETAARNKLGLVQEGETVVIMDNSPRANLQASQNPQMTPWQQWWRLFF